MTNTVNLDNAVNSTHSTSVWVDADACPKIVRELICKTAIKKCIPVTFVSNQALKLQKSAYIKMTVVKAGFDVADNHIVEVCHPNDIVITSDIPLADELIQKQARVVSFKGRLYTADNIKQSLNMRDFMDTMRGTGVLAANEMGQQAAYSDKDKKAFADVFNRLLQAG